MGQGQSNVVTEIMLLKSFEHFDFLTFAILSNHFHLILKSRPDVVERGEKTPLAAFDLVAMPTEEAAKHQRETTVAEKKTQRQAKRRNPTEKRILRDSPWASKRR